MEIIVKVDTLLQNGIPSKYTNTIEYQALLSAVQHLAQHTPDALSGLRTKYREKYEAYRTKRSKYAA